MLVTFLYYQEGVAGLKAAFAVGYYVSAVAAYHDYEAAFGQRDAAEGIAFREVPGCEHKGARWYVLPTALRRSQARLWRRGR